MSSPILYVMKCGHSEVSRFPSNTSDTIFREEIIHPEILVELVVKTVETCS